MIDDAFLRQVAALQTNLKLLESQQDALSDFQDMQALRLYKARLIDYIEAHARAGQLPRDPFQAIEQRLIALSEFFTAADQEYQRLKSWKADWLNSVPAVGLTELQSARTELAERVAEVPRIQERLGQRLSPLDWDTSSPSVDLHSELLACAQCASGLKPPQKAGKRLSLYQFTCGVGDLAKNTSSHFTKLGLRIEELVALHADHVKAVAEGEALLTKQNFRSAGKMLEKIGTNKFSDIHYSDLESGLKEQLALMGRFAALASSIKERLTKGELKSVKEELGKLRALAGNPASEFGHETSELLNDADAQLASFLRARKRSRLIATVVLVVGLVGAVYLAGYVIEERKKATLARTVATAMAEQEAAEAKTKLHADIGAGRVGAILGVPLAVKAVMPFAFCPGGAFTMGSPASEQGRSDAENQVSVTLSKGFWMAQTEVTLAQWQAVMGTNPSGFKGDDLPVESVSWDDAQEFIKKVNGSGVMPSGWKFALPTEAQWEYACRAGEAGPYSGGTIEQVAWYGDWNDEKSARKNHNVGTKKANAWGLHDMHGNVWEWCADWYYATLPGGTDPSGPSSGVNRVYRGGSWFHSGADNCRAAIRRGNDPDDRRYYLGFRPALVPSK
jgi:formylglycine-generating enzyme required for sulfatase activity